MKNYKFETINIDDIIINENKIRYKFNLETELALEESIRQYGLVNPVVITSSKILIDGHLRIKACKALGIKTVTCIIIPDNCAEDYRKSSSSPRSNDNISNFHN